MFKAKSVKILSIIISLTLLTACRSGADRVQDVITGIWEQFAVYPDELFSLGLFEVVRENGEYRMSIYNDDHVDKSRLVRSKGIRDITFDGTTWSFKSDWGRHGTGVFKLEKIDNNTFEGYAYLNGKPKTKNRWVRREAKR